jgi:amino acid adenylation domain-containing protein
MVYLLHQTVTTACERDPDQEAVRISGKSLTYQDLLFKANNLARVLKDQGVKRGDRVGIYMNKCLESAVGIYGAMLAGAAYVPLDPFAPVARLAYVIKDCGIRFLLTNDGKMDQLSQLVAEGVGLEGLIGVQPQDHLPVRCIPWDEIYRLPSLPPLDVGTIEQDLAYILYTSGSTGVPKGIMHTHRSGLSFAEWAANAYGFLPTDRISNHAPLHFDLSTLDFFASAMVGATTVIIPEPVTKFPASLSKLMADEKLTVWYSVPFALIQLMSHGKLETRDLSSLRWVLFAGEPFPTKHLRQLMAQLPHAKFSNLYGPTETNVCTYYNVQEIPADDQPVPIGRPCANVEDLVVDLDDKPVPPGEVGELLIRGGVVMRGYWGQMDMTNRGFYRRQVFSGYQDIFYRTGDLVQLQADGNYKYLGRKDRQIKTRGYRVELDDIEVALLAHELVDEAAVYPVPDGQGSNLIEAAVIPKNGKELTSTELIDHLGLRLPTYAIPAKIHITSDFPRTSTGKINRRELQAQAEAKMQNL